MNKQTVFEIIRKNFLQLLATDEERVYSRSSSLLDSLLEHDWSELFGKPKSILNNRQAEILYKKLRKKYVTLFDDALHNDQHFLKPEDEDIKIRLRRMTPGATNWAKVWMVTGISIQNHWINCLQPVTYTIADVETIFKILPRVRVYLDEYKQKHLEIDTAKFIAKINLINSLVKSCMQTPDIQARLQIRDYTGFRINVTRKFSEKGEISLKFDYDKDLLDQPRDYMLEQLKTIKKVIQFQLESIETAKQTEARYIRMDTWRGEP